MARTARPRRPAPVRRRASAPSASRAAPSGGAAALLDAVRGFEGMGRRSIELSTSGVPTFVNEFWTARQRQGHSLHEVSYRACFKAELPAFFIERLTAPGDVVYDPFAGRGTTPLEAALCGRRPAANDVNPLAQRFLRPRLQPPTLEQVQERLTALDLSAGPAAAAELGLEAFFHPETLSEISALRAYLLGREQQGAFDAVDGWIQMVALNRLTGHSPGFFSVYTLPPNQAVTAQAQRAINARREQTPPRRPIVERILRKTKALLRDVDPLARERLAALGAAAAIGCGPAAATPWLADGSVTLAVTSPPFLDVVDYAADNWLRCWFCGVDPGAVPLTQARTVDDWSEAMTAVLREVRRVLRPGGLVAFEVGEVRGGRVRLEEAVIPAGQEAGLDPVLVMINDQRFTKTANCWGVTNQLKGTNTNRICVFVRPTA